MAASPAIFQRRVPHHAKALACGSTIYPKPCLRIAVALDAESGPNDSAAALQQHHRDVTSSDTKLQLEAMADSISKFLDLPPMIPLLLRFMTQHASDGLALEASYLLGCLCSGNIYCCEGRMAVVEAGGVDILMGMVRGLEKEDQTMIKRIKPSSSWKHRV